jgi:hypothetical protein
MKNLKPELESNQPDGCGVTRPWEHWPGLHEKDPRLIGGLPTTDVKKSPYSLIIMGLS